EAELLRGIATEVALETGVTLWQAGDVVDAAYFVLSGRLQVDEETGSVIEVGIGEGLDERQLLTGGLRSTTVVSLEPVRLLRVESNRFHELVADHPKLLHAMSNAINEGRRADELKAALRRLFGALEPEVEDDLATRVQWMELAPGDILFRQHEPGDALYLVVDGVLAAWAEVDGSEVMLNEIAPGETIGEIALISGAARSATVRAVKPSLLIRLGRNDFEATAARHPLVYKALVEVLGRYLLRYREEGSGLRGAREVVLLPHRPDQQRLQAVAEELVESLSAIGPTLHLSVRRLRDMRETFPFEVDQAIELPLHHPDNTRLAMWLTDQRRQFDFIVYETEVDQAEWSRLCIDRADELVVVADAASDRSPGLWEQTVPADSTATRRLVLVHETEATPTDTRGWLAGRRLDGHHHVRLGRRDDLERVARFVAGRAIGLVLAGGGARGFAHIGVVKALHEAGLPIDLIGGTSSGAMCSLMYAMEPDPYRLAVHNQRDWVDRRPLRKYGPPVLSFLNHRSWDQIFEEAFHDRDIEDLWIPAFCISSNIDAGKMAIHDSGPAWKAVRASASLPAFLAPVLFDGEAHVDGGLVNNLPTDVMRSRTAGPVIAVSLGRRTAERVPFDAYPSPWRLAVDAVNPMKSKAPMHTLPKVMMQIAILGDLAKTDLHSKEADVVLEPPVEKWSMTDFRDVDGVIRAGYEYAIDRLQALAEDETFTARIRSAGVEYGRKPTEN
ncbi:MAG: cyclic nucleotide-binding domain-containing protein, partial [Acidimicrobiia bacterium]